MFFAKCYKDNTVDIYGLTASTPCGQQLLFPSGSRPNSSKVPLMLQIHSLGVGCILTSALPSPPSDSCREEWHLKHTSLRLKLCAAH